MASEGRGDAGVVVAFFPREYRQLVGFRVSMRVRALVLVLTS